MMRHVFVSPHFDDVAFSCGGLVAQLSDAGEDVVVLTVCAAMPGPDDTSPAAALVHAHFGLGGDVVATRRAEDARAVAVLGARAEWLDALDAIYRVRDLASVEALFEPPRDGDTLTACVRARLDGELGRVYLPLGVGRHLDHVLVHAARREAVFYEDLPYAAEPGALAAIGGGFTSREVDVTATFDRKLRAALEYASQVPALFGDADGLALQLTGHASRGGRLYERLYERTT